MMIYGEKGGLRALHEHGIVAPESWVGSGSPDMQGGEAAMVELLGRNLGLSAVFAYNDSMAAGALTTLKDNGIAVPQHLSLIGFDDIPISRYTDPQLTTVLIRLCRWRHWRQSWRYRARRESWIVMPATALCRRWCADIRWRRGKLWGRSLTNYLPDVTAFNM